MDSKFILSAIRAKYPQAAIVHEVVIHDPLWTERALESRPTRRIDALMFESLERTAIEIKVTMADWKRDTYYKRAPWANVTNRFVYAVPKSLYLSFDGNFGIARLEVSDCGVWTVDEDGGVAVVKKANIRKHPEPLPQQVVQSLAYRASRVDSVA